MDIIKTIVDNTNSLIKSLIKPVFSVITLFIMKVDITELIELLIKEI